MEKDTSNLIYHLGKRDMVAEILMMIRSEGIEKTIDILVRSLPDNPHAEWILKNGTKNANAEPSNA